MTQIKDLVVKIHLRIFMTQIAASCGELDPKRD